ncbi:putative MscS family protein YkuT [Roseibium album]|nr:putative MscS family protein YkuT [Roseibium album]
MIRMQLRHPFAYLFASGLLVLWLAFAGDARAQDEAVTIPAGLSDTEFQALLGRLSDEQVRDILIAEFAAQRADEATPGGGLLADTRQIGDALTSNASTLLAKWPEIGGAFSAITSGLSEAGGLDFALIALLICLAAGFVVRHFWRRRAALRQIALAERNVEIGSYGSVGTIADAALFLVIELSSSLAFALTALAALFLLFPNEDLRIFVSSYIALVTIVLIVRSIIDFIFPKNWPIYRLVAISDDATRLVHRVVLGLAALWMFETVTSDLMARFGAPPGTPDLFSLLLGVVWITTTLVGLYLINRATSELLPPSDAPGLGNMLSRNWAALMAIAQVLIWILFTGGSLVAGDVDVVAASVFKTLMVFIASWTAYRILVHYLRARVIDAAICAAIGRTASTFLSIAGLLIVFAVWGLDPATLAAGGSSERALQAAINVALTALVGWTIWDFIRTIIDVRNAAEQPDDDEEAGDGEGGLGASRTATLLPLLRSFAFAAIGLTCLFAALSSLGVNVAPLIAGAGVLGLAIGFGAQTLVKDIVSGVFFLIDDAFRRGEYIDLGSVKGVVERISVRSLQLRHQLGAVHTIPFGDIAALTNYSRDWVIMKLPLRLTFDTDPQMVKKIVKRIGAELMEDELVGDGLLDPPKSQGVIQMEDSAMILRVKFKAIPGKQFAIRRELLHRIRAAFEEAGIRFASREVTVRVSEDASKSEKLEAVGGAASRAVEAEQPAT